MAVISNILQSPVEYLKGVGPEKGKLLRNELGIDSFGDLLEHFPFRHVDKTRIDPIRNLNRQMETAQVVGILQQVEETGAGRKRRLTARLFDGTAYLELAWFVRINWVRNQLKPGRTYLVFGKLGWFSGLPQIAHPEMDLLEDSDKDFRLEPVYPTTEKLKARFITGRSFGNLTRQLLPHITVENFPEFLPASVQEKLKLMPRHEAYRNIHFPEMQKDFDGALLRFKFEELFLMQLKVNEVKIRRHQQSRGYRFDKVGKYFNAFYHDHLPFPLTNAQKRVIREIRSDCGGGRHMNRLLQGDVGSGKTIVALLCMLLAIDNGFQACIMAPTEILAAQHYESIRELLRALPLEINLLTGSTRAAARRKLLESAASGELHILIGTHALIEDKVVFKNLGLAVIDEQHRFGVEQRSKLWTKNALPPHMLIMTATPIPRTLSMSILGDLDVSIIDELPPGRQPVATFMRNEAHRIPVLDFVKAEIAKGRQAYFIFPLIEESEKLEYENLVQGFEHIKYYFPEPQYYLSMVHGRMPPDLKETNMQRFVRGDTQIMVSTTVIEVGVNIPNATVMVIESSEKFGLSQLHQLRGRVGRGSDKSYCILLTGNKLSAEARERLKILTETNDGFKIAARDMELRGPGDIESTRQSGLQNFKVASLLADAKLMEVANRWAERILEDDVELKKPENAALRNHLIQKKSKSSWAKIS